MANRNIPFPGRGGPSADTMEAFKCECGGERFIPTNELVLMYDRLNPKACGPAQILEFSCSKCKMVYVPTPKGIMKLSESEFKNADEGNVDG